MPIMMPMLMLMPRSQCRDFQIALTICHKSYNVQHFCLKILTSKKLDFKFIFLSFCLDNFWITIYDHNTKNRLNRSELCFKKVLLQAHGY